MNAPHEHYQFVVQDLVEKRDELKAELDQLNRRRDVLVSEMEKLRSLIVSMQRYAALPPLGGDDPKSAYKAMSMRWACLKLLSTTPEIPFATGAIANKLFEGGFPPSVNFSSKLSAILGQMATKGEVDRADQGWKISPLGLSAWKHIEQSEKYLRRFDLPVSQVQDEDGVEASS